MQRILKEIIVLLLCILLLSGCGLPPNSATPANTSSLKPDPNLHHPTQPNLTAFLTLDDAFTSISSRIYLIENAKSSIDLQYYIWKDDDIGQLMLAKLLQAANRGVKIRLLLDDNNGNDLDPQLKALAQHPNFQIRLFNPFKFRHARVIDYLFRTRQINRRMHNKLIIGDGNIAVTGGRNISSEYFDASQNFQFTDLDILFYGAAMSEANHSFLEFWNDGLSYDVRDWLAASRQSWQQLEQYYQQQVKPRYPLDQLQQAQQRLTLNLQQKKVAWATAHFVADPPSKARGEAQPQQLMYQQMQALMGVPTQQMELVSAYFVPTQKGVDYLTQLSQNGVKVRVLTNSLAANDVALVHAYYQKYRKDLLKNGVKLYEFKPYIQRSEQTWYERLTGQIIPDQNKNRSSLHAKFFDSDDQVFIGSFNFDPRSAHLNTEVGLVIQSSTLQQQISQALDQYLPTIAYELSLDKHQQLMWTEWHADQNIQYTVDPQSTWLQRQALAGIAYLPFEGLM